MSPSVPEPPCVLPVMFGWGEICGDHGSFLLMGPSLGLLLSEQRDKVVHHQDDRQPNEAEEQKTSCRNTDPENVYGNPVAKLILDFSVMTNPNEIGSKLDLNNRVMLAEIQSLLVDNFDYLRGSFNYLRGSGATLSVLGKITSNANELKAIIIGLMSKIDSRDSLSLGLSGHIDVVTLLGLGLVLDLDLRVP